MIVLNLYYKLKPDTKEEFLKEVYSSGIVKNTQAESGCIAYDFYPSYNKDIILLIEKWADNESLNAHKEQEHLKKLLSLKEKYGITTTVDAFTQNS